MIAVIADDLSGAAELAGIAARYGYRAEVHTAFDPRTDAEVVAIDTDTRWRSADQAAEIVADISAAVLAGKPEWIFKKTDSVLRGNVRAEIEAILSITGQKRAMLIPANPSKGRIIRGGVYFIGEAMLAQTAFRRDPEHPRLTSIVIELLGIGNVQDKLMIPDATCTDDLATRAVEVNAETLPAGGADFFEAILQTKGRTKVSFAGFPAALKSPVLFVCGSAAAWDNGRAEECAVRGIPIVSMPQPIFDGDITLAAMREWDTATSAALRAHSHAMLAIGRGSGQPSTLKPKQLLELLTRAVAEVLATEKVACLALEGGGTAAAILQHFGWGKLKAISTDLTGIAVLSPEAGPTLLIKPGSYPWTGVIV